MTEKDRTDFLRTGLQTIYELGDVPAYELEQACKEVRQTCTHPSKIVPTIIEYLKPKVMVLQGYLADVDAEIENISSPRISHEKPRIWADERERMTVGADIDKLIKRLGGGHE